MSTRTDRRPDSIRVLLGLNALLLGGILWTQVAERPLVAGDAVAGSSLAAPTPFPNASDQRRAIEKAVIDLRKSVDRISSDLDRTKLRVEVTNVDDIAEAMRAADKDG